MRWRLTSFHGPNQTSVPQGCFITAYLCGMLAHDFNYLKTLQAVICSCSREQKVTIISGKISIHRIRWGLLFCCYSICQGVQLTSSVHFTCSLGLHSRCIIQLQPTIQLHLPISPCASVQIYAPIAANACGPHARLLDLCLRGQDRSHNQEHGRHVWMGR